MRRIDLDDAREVLRVAHVLRREGAALDEVEHQHARLGVGDARRDAGGVRGAARRELVLAHDAVRLVVAADPDDEFLAVVLDDEIDVGEPAAQIGRLDRVAPQGQRRGLPPGRADLPVERAAASLQPSPSLRFMRLAEPVIMRSAIMAIMATPSPATMPRPTSALASAI